ncbi:hypothetical protein HHI36_012346 [Cryptolaemus montrouzieri]|uniref:Uncharacterized protein n=1 Tax=Cryptolaemus montrouzieri TaxID=559131 RepID=A0ABD2NEP3_9CUCU
MSVFIQYLYLVYCLVKWFLLRLFTNGRSDSVACLEGKTAIVTGGNSGIGLAISMLLASRGCRVIIADVVDARKSIENIIERTKNKNIVGKYINLASIKEIRKFADDINKNEKKIDILINNAGIGTTTQGSTEDELNTVMQVNYFGPFLLTHLLIDSLKSSDSARVIFVGSIMAFMSKLSPDNMGTILNLLDFEFNTSIAYMLYQNSKLCNVFAAQEFAKKLRKHKINVNSSDPGAVLTYLTYTANELYEGLFGAIVRMFKITNVMFHIYGEVSV